jgi:hypothetical protein
LNAFGDSFTSRSSCVPTGLAPPPDGSGLAVGGDDGWGLPAGGGDGSGLTAGRAGSADLPAHAPASKTAAVNVARIQVVVIITRR